MIKIMLFCLVFFPFSSFAQTAQVRMSAEDCQKLMAASAQYVPDVSVTGQAVVPADVSDTNPFSTTGQPVAPADLNGPVAMNLENMQTLTLPVSFDLSKDQSFWNSSLDVGDIPVVRVKIENGQIFVNGTLVSGNDLNALKKACSDVTGRGNIDKNHLTNVQ